MQPSIEWWPTLVIRHRYHSKLIELVCLRDGVFSLSYDEHCSFDKNDFDISHHLLILFSFCYLTVLAFCCCCADDIVPFMYEINYNNWWFTVIVYTNTRQNILHAAETYPSIPNIRNVWTMHVEVAMHWCNTELNWTHCLLDRNSVIALHLYYASYASLFSLFEVFEEDLPFENSKLTSYYSL